MVKILYNNKIVKKQYTNGNVINKIPFHVEGEGSRLPSGYTEVEYIRQTSDTRQYSNTKWTIPITNMVSGDSFTIVFSMDSSQNGISRYISIFGSDEVFAIRNDRGFNFGLNTKYFTNGLSNASYTMEYDTKLSFNYKPSLLTVTNVTTGVETLINLSQSSGYNPSGNLGVFGYWYGGTNEYIMKGNVYEIKIEGSDDTLKYDYIPCKRDSDDKVGLYDIVNDVFASPSGFTITAGQEVAPQPQKETLYWQYADMGTPTPPTPSYDTQYLTIESTSDNNTIYWKKGSSRAQIKTISASTDNGNTWTAYTSSTGGAQIATLNAGDKLLVKGENSTYAVSASNYNQFQSTDQFEVKGNIMSLVYGDNFSGQTTLTSGNTFNGLFSQCYGLTSAENLILPATTLTNSCYQNMFSNCTSLTTAPELSATTLAEGCYNYMFENCTSLNYIKCLATNIPASNCTSSWVDGVSSTGTFVKAASMSSWATGTSGIPNGWTIQNDDGSPVDGGRVD